ncbi:putative monooxygenase [Trichoderma asperelloides]|nr:putative monooxygenase [Trichoderma asperelloides]
MDPSQVPIAIIGAGPAGLSLARLLELAGIDYVVFERDESATSSDESSSSGTLDIHKDFGQAVLKEAGLLEEFQSIARYDVPIKIADAQGIVQADIPGSSNTDKPEIDRKDLRNLLLRSIPVSRIRWGCRVQQVHKEIDGSISVHTNGRVESGFHLVVGADGAWSKVRKQVNFIEPQYSGTHFFTTFIRLGNPTFSSAASLAGKGNYLAMSKGRHIFLHYLGDGSYHLSVGVKLIDSQAVKSGTVLHDPSTLWESLLQNEFVGWAQDLTEFIKSSALNFRSWPLYSTPKTSLPWKYTPGLTLLGDAAHLTVPTGDGVNNALNDSAELAKQIIKHGTGNLEAAVVDYEKATLPRAIKAIEKGHWFIQHFFGVDAPQEFLYAASAKDN